MTGWNRLRSAALRFLSAVVMVGLFSCGPESAKPEVVDSQRIVTLDEFSQIREGMTYEEVVAIIGEPGTEHARERRARITKSLYSWSNRDASRMIALFENDSLTLKVQVGL